MKKKILVLQFRTDQSLDHERSCIAYCGSFDKSELHFLNVLDLKNRLPELGDLEYYKGVILGGSGEVNISDWSKVTKNRILKVKSFLKQIIKKDLPILGICFGHQLIAYILGGKVEADQKQAETGTYEINLTKEGLKCPLFTGILKSFYAVLGHHDSVISLPRGAKLLAASARCKTQAYWIKNNIFAVQFHPELNKKGIEFRLNLFPSYVKGKNINELLKNYKQTPFASKVLVNFKNICG